MNSQIFYRLGHISWLSLGCFLGMIALIVDPNLSQYGMHSTWMLRGDWGQVVLQFVLYQFLHGGFLHALSNVFFLVFIGIGVQHALGKKRFLALFLFTTVFVGSILLFGGRIPTIGMSGFAMAILSVYTMMLWSIKNEQYKSGLVLIGINIFIGLDPSISLGGHLWGAVSGVVFWLFIRKKIQVIPSSRF